MPQIQDLIGLWQRSLVAWPDGRRDTTTCVRWLQGREMFVDLRQPTPLPGFPHALSINDLSMRDCACLATQQGFAGRLRFDGRHFEWARQIDFQPKSPIADAGSLEWQADVLVERGRDVDYIEHWHRDGAAATVPQGAVELREGRSRYECGAAPCRQHVHVCPRPHHAATGARHLAGVHRD